MSHFPVLVIVDKAVTRKSAEDVITPLLAPYDENDEWFREGSRWDWWCIGGRWTGCISGDYEPRDDPRNYETCRICFGTGERPNGKNEFGEEWYVEMNGCNGCRGEGKALKFSFEDFDGDVIPLKQYKPRTETYRDRETGEEKPWTFKPTAVVTPDGEWHEQARVGWFGSTIENENGEGEKSEREWEGVVNSLFAQHPDATLVLVDCHV